jgi:3-oxocholest-4-en-26-oyl-CoA dehydrogenase beta subunit
VDLALSEGQEEARELAARILSATVSPDDMREMRAAGKYLDAKAWQAFVDAGLVGLAIPESYGGSGLGFLEACVVLEQIGRRVAPVPYYATVILGALPVVQFGNAAQRKELLPSCATGETLLTAALLEDGASPELPQTIAWADREGWCLEGQKDHVASGCDADRMLVSASTEDGPAIFIVDPNDQNVQLERQDATNEIPEARVILSGARGEHLAGSEALPWMVQRATTALCAMAIGVCDEAVRLTAEYTSTRQQFDRPIATFQAVSQRAADAYIEAEAVRLTTWQAAWRLSEGMPATAEVATAKFWAADGGQRIVAAAQHLHGGIGVDRDYPLHRYYLWAKWIQLNLGGASQQLRKLGHFLAGDD